MSVEGFAPCAGEFVIMFTLDFKGKDCLVRFEDDNHNTALLYVNQNSASFTNRPASRLGSDGSASFVVNRRRNNLGESTFKVKKSFSDDAPFKNSKFGKLVRIDFEFGSSGGEVESLVIEER